ncbi:xanthine dehydrogenase family protein subunit M [Kibdelosporangium philippinense]|uniref:Xanthine dehydrogenase family protein subunit M n=1 Tax=Kibdelosporangium philippinense TaxID=211113 RepID=A0ABS8Z4A0_9PSEU|nr:xanthine dehydrogenase family protein subunit M [Kibdelosporangium philippinense]MCE7002751.1 xanthine dehydrogenase family protein subunit M [Kibdelosporangium philippinense]
MHGFAFAAPTTTTQALTEASDRSAFLAGGTTLVDLMKLDVMTPAKVIDINDLPMRGIQRGRDGVTIGALERMTDVALSLDVARLYPVVSQALFASASGQLRNMASIGGNLLQRTRCDYFRDVTMPCNKRQPGSGCPAQTGENRGHAILGTSNACVATHASDLAVALVAMDAKVRLLSKEGERTVALNDFYRLPGDTPSVENVLKPGELVTHVHLPRLDWARFSAYVKVRDRSSYEFALASAAVVLDIRGDKVFDARIAVGGVGTKPWRLPQVEQALKGNLANEDSFTAAAEKAAEGARPLEHNGFKAVLVQRTIVRALMSVRGVR